MKHYDITKPIGLATPCKEIEHTCSKAQMYKQCGLRPNHYIIPLDPGSGRTTLVEYMTDKYKEAGVLSFNSGLDDYIEVAFDGSLQQLKQAFAAIDSAAVYTNEYQRYLCSPRRDSAFRVYEELQEGVRARMCYLLCPYDSQQERRKARGKAVRNR